MTKKSRATILDILVPMTAKRASYSQYGIPGSPPKVAPTDDDDQILLEVYRHDIIDAAAIYSLLPHRTPNKIGRRLNALRKAGHLYRLQQLEQIFKPGGGSYSKAYTLGGVGSDRLEEKFGLKIKPRRWKQRSRELSAQFILHGLEQTRFMISLRMSAEKSEDVEFLYPEQIYERFAPEVLEREFLPYKVSARVNWFGHTDIEGTNPDGFCMLFYPKLEENLQQRPLFIELDRGTETIDIKNERKLKSLKFWKDTSLLRKFVVYAYAFRTKTHKKVFGVPAFQVLTVTTKPSRVAKMQAMYRKRLAGRPHSVKPFRFLFTDFETIKKYDNDILAVPISDGSGKVRTLA